MWIEVVSGLIAGGIAGFIGGSVLGWFTGWQYQSKQIEFERKLNQLWGSMNTGKGVAMREQLDQETQEIMAQAIAIWKGEGEQSEKVNKMLGLAASNPKACMRILKQLGVSL